MVVPIPECHVNLMASAPGPQTRPLLFTGLRHPPERLSWMDAPDAPAYLLELVSPAGRTETRRARSVFTPLELPECRPGEPVDWTMTPLGLPERALGGRFWLLTADSLTRLNEAQKVVARIEDIEMRAIAQAITAAEFGLYDEAVDVLDALLNLVPLKAHGALAHRAFVTVFSEMQEKIPSDVNGAARTWTQARLRAHWEALSRCLPVSGPRLPGWPAQDRPTAQTPTLPRTV